MNWPEAFAMAAIGAAIACMAIFGSHPAQAASFIAATAAVAEATSTQVFDLMCRAALLIVAAAAGCAFVFGRR